MKLRIKGNSLRLRVSQPELRQLLAEGRVEETIHFGNAPDARLTYALIQRPIARAGATVEYQAGAVTVVLSHAYATDWLHNNEVGIYAEIDTPAGPLGVSIEKDFACLDGDEPVDPDAFPNPKAGTAC